MNRSDSKKFETWQSGVSHFSGACDTREGETVEVRVVTGSRGGETSGFRACFESGHTIEDTDIARLRIACRRYILDRRDWVWERVMDIQVSNGFRSGGEDSGEVSVSFDIMDRVKGKDDYFDTDHTHKSHVRGTVIPWTVEREAAIRLVIKHIDQVYDDLQSILGDKKKAQVMLDTVQIGRMLSAKENNGFSSEVSGA